MLAFKITVEDVLVAINSDSSKQLSLEDAQEVLAALDMAEIEKVTLYGFDADQRAIYAHNAIRQQFFRAIKEKQLEQEAVDAAANKFGISSDLLKAVQLAEKNHLDADNQVITKH